MSHNFLRCIVLAVAVVTSGYAFAQEATIDQIYREAQSGNLAEAQAMMAGVLHAHPNSAKAHFVSAELLTRQGRLADADIELRAAERLEPGLPFTTPQAVQELRRRIGAPRSAVSGVAANDSPRGTFAPSTGAGVPWFMLLVLAGIALLVFFGMQALRRRSAASQPPGNSGYATDTPMQGSGVAPRSPMGGGMGSGILGGLATGAAVGAGMVAGEALAHRFSEGHHDTSASSSGVGAGTAGASDSMGGNDFGVADNSSWDDNLGGGGGSDWS